MELHTKGYELIARARNIILENQALREIRLRSQHKLPSKPAKASDSPGSRWRARQR